MRAPVLALLGFVLGAVVAVLGPRLLEERRDVLVFARDLPRGHVIEEGDIAVASWPARFAGGSLDGLLQADLLGQELGGLAWEGVLVTPFALASPAKEPEEPEWVPRMTWWDVDGAIARPDELRDGAEVVVRTRGEQGWQVLIRSAEARWAPDLARTGPDGPPPGTFGLGIRADERSKITSADEPLQAVEPWRCDLPASPSMREREKPRR